MVKILKNLLKGASVKLITPYHSISQTANVSQTRHIENYVMANDCFHFSLNRSSFSMVHAGW